MPRRKKTKKESTDKYIGLSRGKRKTNKVGNWRGIEDHFFNKVRKGFERILSPKY